MFEESGAPAGDSAAPVIDSTPLPADAPATFNSPAEAAKYFTGLKEKKPAAEAPEATAETELAQANGDPETALAEEPEGNEPEENLPPIERPRSWSKDDDDDWNALPRARQEKIAANELAREKDIRQRINEAAEARKAVEAEREAAAKARQQYEAQLPNLLKELESVNQAQFGDIRTMDDVVRLQSEDPFRFQAWQVHQMRLQASKQEAERAESQKAEQKLSKRANYEAEQNKLLVELVPEMADPKKASELRERAVKMLTDDLGLSNQTLSQWMQDDTGHEILSNASIQRLIADGLEYRAIKAAPKAVASNPVPPVQRPGTSKPAVSSGSERIQALTRQLNETGSLKAAQELRALQSNQRRAS